MATPPTRNVLKEDFNWEVPVETVPLPSQGKIYNPDSLLYNRETVDIKAMTAKEEDILTSPALLKRGETVSTLVESCITDGNINVDEMILGDRNALMISIRVTGYGQDYRVSIDCPKCSHSNNKTVDLGNLPIKFLEISPVKKGLNEFDFTLPVTKKNVTFKFITVKDEREMSQTREKMNKHFDVVVENNVTANLEQCIMSIDGIRDKNKIRHFVQYMPAFDSKSLRNFIKENEPGIKMEYDLVCDDCTNVSSVIVPMSSEFFWPSE